MKQTGKLARLLLLALLGVLVCACGKKGPLYLPPGKAPLIKPVPEAPAEPLDKSESESEKKTDKPQP